MPVEPKVTNRSQPFVDAQIERAEAEEALRTPLRPSGRVLAVVFAMKSGETGERTNERTNEIW